MPVFSDLLQEEVNNGGYRTRNRIIIECICNIILNDQNLKEGIDNALIQSIKECHTRDQIFENIQQYCQEVEQRLRTRAIPNHHEDNNGAAINGFLEDGQRVTDLIYHRALSLLSGHQITIEETEYTIRRRQGPNGGLYTTLTEAAQGNNQELENIKSEIEENINQIEQAEAQNKRLEKHYYPVVLEWSRTHGFPECRIIGGQLSGAKWENPDLIEISCDHKPNTVSMEIAITSFEVKLKIDPYAVWQAAHYKKFSTYTFLAFAQKKEDLLQSDKESILELAISFGLGILTLRNDNDQEFELVHFPTRNNPSNREIDILVSRYSEFHQNFQLAKRELARHLISDLSFRAE